jgi:hypothetical protein
MVTVNDSAVGVPASAADAISAPRTFGQCITEFLDDLAARIFAVNDSARESEGFQVSSPSRFTRRYRHPAMAIALNAAAIRQQRNASRDLS